MKSLFLIRRLNVLKKSLIEVSSSSTFSTISRLFLFFRFSFSAAILRLRAARGSSFGKNAIKKENVTKTLAMNIQPKYQAPNQRGSLLLITGVRSGAMYILRLNDAKAYPAAGPSNRIKYDKPIKKEI